jgi:hypothetical protein
MESARAWEVNSGRSRKTKGESMELQPSLVHSIQVRDHALPPKPPVLWNRTKSQTWA